MSQHKAGAHAAGGNQWLGDTGASGNGSWTTAADWSGGSVPGATASVTFATGYAGYTVLGDATVGSISISDQLTFDGTIAEGGSAATFLTGDGNAALTLDANAFLSGNGIAFASGSLLDVQGLLTSTGGTASTVIVEGVSGQAIFANALTVDSLYVQTGGSFTGDVTVTDGGNITLDTSSNFGGDTITLLGSASIYDALAPGGVSGETGIGDAIAIASGGTLDLGADPGVTFDVSGPISGSGALLISGGTVQLTGTNSYTGSTTVQDGTLSAFTGAVPANAVTVGGATEQAALVSLSDGALSVQAGTGAFVTLGYGTSDTVDASSGTGSVTAFGGIAGTLNFIGGAGLSSVVGGAGAISVTGGAGALTVFGGTGASTVVAGSGQLNAIGGAGPNLIFGGSSGHDVIYSGTGASTLVGFDGASLVATGSANDALVAGGGNVYMDASASSGNDTLFGGPAGGTTNIHAGSGLNTVVLDGAGAGAANVFAGANTDIFAGTGALTLTFTAGAGAEAANVLGFDVGQDQIALSGFAAGTASQILAAETVSGGNTILNIPGSDQLILFGVTNLSSANFV